MKIETLKDRIKKAEEKKVKLNGTLERHQKQLEKKAKVLIDKGIDPNNCDRYDHRQTQIYWDICDYDSKLEDIKSNERKIEEVNKTLETLKEQLKNQLAKENETESLIPEVLNIFLENWKQKAYDFYINLANEYIEVINKEYEITKEELEKLETTEFNWKSGSSKKVRKYSDEKIQEILNDCTEYEKRMIKSEIKDRNIKQFRNNHFASDVMVLNRIVEFHQSINTEDLNKLLDDEVKDKKEMFIARIKQVIGEIKDLKGLTIGSNGEINGIAKGVKCNAKVETITAGGYNIQCYHFRVLVNTVK